jgi:transcriptional regulator with XRE-family HTH domain
MNNFGEKLRKTRQRKKMNLDKVEDATQIQRSYLEAIEDGDLRSLPGEVYAKNFVKKYALFLELDPEEFLENLNSSYRGVEKEEKKFGLKSKKRNYQFFNLSFAVTPKIVKNIIIFLVFILCFAYLGVEAKGVFNPPPLEIYNPTNNTVIQGQKIEIVGKTDSGVNISINEKNILTDNDGNFKEEINLQSGVNVIKISANKKYSKTNTIQRRVLVVED